MGEQQTKHVIHHLLPHQVRRLLRSCIRGLCDAQARWKEFEVKAPEEVPAGVGFACPFVTFPEGYSISQTGAIGVAVGKACELAPADAAGDAKAQQLMADGVNIQTEMGAAKPVERIAKWMEHFETLLGDNDYFINNTLSYADFSLFQAFDLMEAKKALGKYEGYEMGPKMTAWLERMKAVPALAEMAASGIPHLPAAYM